MKCLVIRKLVFGAGILWCSLPVQADDGERWIAHHLELGRRFYEAGDFVRSSEEYERALILIGPTAPLRLQLGLADSYYRAGRFSDAQAVMSERMSATLSSPCPLDGKSDVDLIDCLDTKLLLAKSLIQMDAYQSAEGILNEIVGQETQYRSLAGQKDRQAADKFLRSRLLLASTLASQSRLAEAKSNFEAVIASKPQQLSYTELAKNSEHLIQNYETDKPYRSGVASLLAVVPGLGHAYIGEYAVAASSFIVNSALLYMTYDSWHKSRTIPNYSLATTVGWGTLAATFYTANIYSAGELAHRRNDDRRAKLRRNLLDLNLNEENKARAPSTPSQP